MAPNTVQAPAVLAVRAVTLTPTGQPAGNPPYLNPCLPKGAPVTFHKGIDRLPKIR
jgi:hypothetical protein